MSGGPKCLWCGKPLRKHTTTLWFGPREGRPYPKSREEAGRHTNGTIVSVRWSSEPVHREDGCIVGGVPGSRVVYVAGVWDGESYGMYGDGLFCTIGCGYAYGSREAKRRRAG